jgi:hypothetical protein
MQIRGTKIDASTQSLKLNLRRSGALRSQSKNPKTDQLISRLVLLDIMDTEEEIEKMAEKLTNDQGWTKLKALSMLQSRYESERRLEEAVIVKRIIDREESKPEQTGKGFHNEP